MLSWLFGPQLHVTTQEKAWVEMRLRWLLLADGERALRTEPQAAREVCQRLLQGMVAVDPESLADLVEAVSLSLQSAAPAVRASGPASCHITLAPKASLTDGQDTAPGNAPGRLVDRPTLEAFRPPSAPPELAPSPASPSPAHPSAASRTSEPVAALGDADLPAALGAVLRIDLGESDARIVAAALRAVVCSLFAQSGLLRGDEPDWEALVDLLPVFCGYGGPAANLAISEVYVQDGVEPLWGLQRWGRVPARVAGYAMALRHWYRGEAHPDRGVDLRPDARESLQASLRYLRRTADCLIEPGVIPTAAAQRSERELLDALRSRSPSQRLVALRDVQDAGWQSAGIRDAVAAQLNHPDAAVRGEAAYTMSWVGPITDGQWHQLAELIQDSHKTVRARCAIGLGSVARDPEQAARLLGQLLSDQSPEVVAAANAALQHLGAAPQITGQLVKALKFALSQCNAELAGALYRTLHRSLGTWVPEDWFDVEGDADLLALLQAIIGGSSGGDRE